MLIKNSPIARCLIALLVATTLPSLVLAQDDRGTNVADKPVPTADQAGDKPLEGHSHYGHSFNEGPRQAAYLIPGMPKIDFPVTTKSDEAKAFFNQGIGQLHGFWYFEAERTFRQVAKLDPDCAMAYWGMAHANLDNTKRARGFIEKAMERIDGCTERERMYIEPFAAYLAEPDKDKNKQKAQRAAYVDACKALMEKYPDDLEAKAFYVYAAWYNGRKGVPIKDYDAISQLIDEIHAADPLHPAHHYKIHLWDYKEPKNAVEAASFGGPSGPGIAHLWHMPGHTYSRLHRYHDAAWQQEASARVDHAHMMRDRVMPDQIHNFAHNNEWLIRNLMNVGRADDALSLARNMTELPMHPKYNSYDTRRGSAAYGRKRLIDTLKKFEMWEQAIALCHSVYLPPTEKFDNKLGRWNLLGTSYFFAGKVAEGDALIQSLEDEKKAMLAEADKLTKTAEGLFEQVKQLAKAETEEGKQKGTEIKTDAEAKKKEATTLRSDTKRIDTILRELRAHQALAHDDIKKAAELYDKVKKQIGDQMMSLVYLRLGEHDKAIEAAERFAESKSRATVVAMANLAYVQREVGRADDAAETFDKLRTLAVDADMHTRPLKRLTALAAACGCGGYDWRMARIFPADTQQSIDLDTLGPFRWRPYKADPWTLPDRNGKLVSLDDYKGKPVLVIFYLGFGCLHCVEQLNAFAPMTQQYKDAGIDIIAISSDNILGLAKSAEYYNEEGTFPFPIVSDHSLEYFKQYRAFDDFENMTLHGTFLIDKKGYVRWQDISYEPFMEAEFLLKESKRLLAQPDEVVYGG